MYAVQQPTFLAIARKVINSALELQLFAGSDLARLVASGMTEVWLPPLQISIMETPCAMRRVTESTEASSCSQRRRRTQRSELASWQARTRRQVPTRGRAGFSSRGLGLVVPEPSRGTNCVGHFLMCDVKALSGRMDRPASLGCLSKKFCLRSKLVGLATFTPSVKSPRTWL